MAGLSLNSVLYPKAISGWFSERRGLMLSIAMSGSGVGAALIPLFVSHLIQTVGWRCAYRGLDLLVIAVAAPAVFFLVQSGQPADAEKFPGGQNSNQN